MKGGVGLDLYIFFGRNSSFMGRNRSTENGLPLVDIQESSLHNDHGSSDPKPVQLSLFKPVNFSVYIYKMYVIYKKFKNLIHTSKFKFSFRGLLSNCFVLQNAAFVMFMI
jgi:hypothetical protein